MPLRSLFIDMNSFFASVEQHLRPELRDKPIAVVPVDTDSTCCIAASYSAKRFGIKTGTPVWQAKQLCSGLIVVQARPAEYIRIHHQIAQIVESHLHFEKAISIDEMACPLPSNFSSPERALTIALQIKKSLLRSLSSAITCSIGIAPNRFLAKIASNLQKPDGLTILRSEDLPEKILSLPLRALPGIGANMHRRLLTHGIDTFEKLWHQSSEDLARVWGGIVGREFWLHLHGHETLELPTLRRTVGHSHVLPPPLRNDDGAKAVLVRLLHKAMARLHYMGYRARRLSLSIRYVDQKYFDLAASVGYPQDALMFLERLDQLWQRRPAGKPLKVGVTLFHLEREKNLARPLFDHDQRTLELSDTMNKVNEKFGPSALYFATMHNARHHAPLRIAFTVIPDQIW